MDIKWNTTPWGECIRLSAVLLQNLKESKNAVIDVAGQFDEDEFDMTYRWYHWSFKVFSRQRAIRRASDLFEAVAPDGRPLNPWYCQFRDDALGREFTGETNDDWVGRTLPVLTAWQHTHSFLRALRWSVENVDEPPRTLPSGWALTLYLFNCR